MTVGHCCRLFVSSMKSRLMAVIVFACFCCLYGSMSPISKCYIISTHKNNGKYDKSQTILFLYNLVTECSKVMTQPYLYCNVKLDKHVWIRSKTVFVYSDIEVWFFCFTIKAGDFESNVGLIKLKMIQLFYFPE